MNTSTKLKDVVAQRELVSSAQQPAIKFPQDDLEAWKQLIYWIGTGKFALNTVETDSKDPSLLMRCWLLGAKYKVLDFQDCAMMDLLRFYDQGSRGPMLSREELNQVFHPVG